MVLTAVRGGLGFLTRLPGGDGEAEWDSFRRSPVAFPLVGYIVGGLAAVPFVLPVPVPTAAALYLVTLYLVTGVTHADGLADLGDAAVVHGDAERRLSVLKDSQTGVGGLLALGLTLVVLGLGALGLAGLGGRLAFTPAVAIAVAAEVGAKTGMATLVCLGEPAHEGLGSALVGENGQSGLFAVAVACLPVAALALLAGGLGVIAALVCGPVVALALRSWGRTKLGGVSGDLLGATNELARAAAIHVGVVAWTLF
ncbi:adenosylcobinamide-GDP ribazoletransferase [Haloferax mediterranei ATCC 33500]|uniref:Adenosylcobinamide-GDP ribazoletransferase n=1 Tax=Haloferax mediterranei (strain ATCC 33500 / DSM 1411 / JCM 8866 / NBRC 14739 / NCIMB 2177 / R-4) TaxID=523841 RepID=I3R240_HALMT|nr:adenosylcobinamide-GDP ribazoletransferase [Haloferax mediterranei]AFK18300.1 cobalamin (5'-phosphate) synthase / adenosylcobinamide-GDP ribazoletransferase [Haloferax mediterranei ATCC 33500]AHZ22301.1 cobalamin synthase [Haloferax mediterranei ATCC 33500]EMA02428.1 cobalamin (5'-phosphate) synthase / adenosylcobinamide-GDP ribazoletransferase [Haloferax mediterranei ATCC 33500]MDX5988389.1 adenosylcobinamide-GDP ribazoletransferase [Haloferax mediterranei ATCC 33500]QCQ74818.1 adenosylcob